MKEMEKELNREEAWDLLCEYTKSESLRRHALAVEAAMRHFARRWGEDEEKWGVTGLLHDMDYERWPSPEDHPLRGAAILQEMGYPEDVIYAIKAHADYLEVPRESRMDKALYAVDEVTGLIAATAMVMPSRSLHEVTLKSLKKKWKQKSFAAGVDREQVAAGAEALGLSVDELLEEVLVAMQGVAEELGLPPKVNTD